MKPEERVKLYHRFKELGEGGVDGKERVDIINLEFGTTYSRDEPGMKSLRQFVSKTKDKPYYQDSLNNLKTQNSYELEGHDIVFYVNKKNEDDEVYKERIAIPVEEVGEICYDYTYGGLSGKKVQIKHGLKPRAWNLLKSRLNITKDSNALPDVVLDYIASEYGEQAVEEKILDVSHRAAKDKYRNRFVTQYDKSKERLDDKIRKTFATRENYLEWVRDYLREYKQEDISFPVIPSEKEDTALVYFTDLHLKGTDEKVKECIGKIVQDIHDMKEKNIILVYGGDTFESLAQNGMHAGQMRDISLHGRKMIFYAADIISQMLIEIRKKKNLEFYAMPGNHDRISTKNEDDLERLGSVCLLLAIELRLEKCRKDIKITHFEEAWNSLKVMGFNFLFHHGDFGVSGKTKNKATNLLWEYGDTSMQNIIMVGHEHHIEQKDVSDNAIVMICPALAGPGEYDKRLGLSSYSGYKVIRSKRGVPCDENIRLI